MKSKVYIYTIHMANSAKNPLFLRCPIVFAPKKTSTKPEALPPTQRHFPHPQASQVTPEDEKIRGVN